MILSIIEQALIALPLIMGAYLILSLLKLPDFSIENAYLFGAVVSCLMKEYGLPIAILGAMGGGIVVGITVCFLNQCLKIPFLIAAIVTNGIYHGLAQYCLKTSVKSFHLSLPFQELSLLVGLGSSLLAVMFLVTRSQLGMSFAIYGNNPLFFAHHDISGRFVVFAGVAIGHGLIGIGGFLFAQSNGFVDLTMNFGVILLCLTSLMMGKLAFRTSSPNLLIPFIGVIFYFILQQSLLRLGLELKYFNAFQALCVLGMLCIRQRKSELSFDHLGV